MIKLTALFLPLLLLFQLKFCFAQETLTITNPVLDTLGKKLIIKYDILNSKPGEIFNVTLFVTDSRGATLNSKTITGDIGNNISGGTGKQIVWDYISDNVKDEVEISIKIIIKKIEKRPVNDGITSSGSPAKGGLILQSIALPGLGLSKLKENKPYWIMGIAGYGLIGSSIAFKLASNKNYDNFMNTSDPGKEVDYYNNFKKQKSISKGCIIGAAAIWVTDLVFIFRASSKPKETTRLDQRKKISFIADYDFTTNLPLIKLKYVF